MVVMTTETKLAFQMPKGRSLRQVASAMVQEWLPPFRAEAPPKAARWTLQAVMERPDSTRPLWEAGISTDEYEQRLDREVSSWAIRATAGRGRGIILARLVAPKERPGVLEVLVSPAPMPETMLDADKVNEFVDGQEPIEGGLLAAILRQQGFEPFPES